MPYGEQLSGPTKASRMSRLKLDAETSWRRRAGDFVDVADSMMELAEHPGGSLMEITKGDLKES
ncbi:hypothetical protein Tdes44962_MAKER08789 [Teratosphaeria destructans]|uniref:Uncharacterized protein n=1 Tax=Teratosphaeria destructans TaxID=418781 RepID=A0A9W7W4G4_9PEZI|nr:hypothetical protein Tdes44962_MAKER08789 [Teratosphaeria destructans]